MKEGPGSCLVLKQRVNSTIATSCNFHVPGVKYAILVVFYLYHPYVMHLRRTQEGGTLH